MKNKTIKLALLSSLLFATSSFAVTDPKITVDLYKIVKIFGYAQPKVPANFTFAKANIDSIARGRGADAEASGACAKGFVALNQGVTDKGLSLLTSDVCTSQCCSFALGYAYSKGLGVSIDKQKAFDYFSAPTKAELLSGFDREMVRDGTLSYIEDILLDPSTELKVKDVKVTPMSSMIVLSDQLNAYTGIDTTAEDIEGRYQDPVTFNGFVEKKIGYKQVQDVKTKALFMKEMSKGTSARVDTLLKKNDVVNVADIAKDKFSDKEELSYSVCKKGYDELLKYNGDDALKLFEDSSCTSNCCVAGKISYWTERDSSKAADLIQNAGLLNKVNPSENREVFVTSLLPSKKHLNDTKIYMTFLDDVFHLMNNSGPVKFSTGEYVDVISRGDISLDFARLGAILGDKNFTKILFKLQNSNVAKKN